MAAVLAAGRGRRRAAPVVCGGEALEPGGWREWCGTAGRARLVNMYGPTETHGGCHRSGLDAGAAGGPARSGAPSRTPRVLVLDEWLGPVPAGVAGELYVAGVQVARGYRGGRG